MVCAGKPKVIDRTFPYLPSALFYFEDSPVILVFDPKGGDVWRSENDGNDWKQVPEFKGKAHDIMEHPFDKEKAVVFTQGKEHWVTKDKGASWSKFEVELPASIRQPAIVFNANNTNYALYSGRECGANDFFGTSCKDKVGHQKNTLEIRLGFC